MGRVVVAVALATAVFLAGFAAGRASLPSASEDTVVDPDAAAMRPGSEADPIEIGSPAAVGPWEVEVTGFDPDAIERVLAANQFNVEPAEGQTYVTVEVSLTRRAAGPGILRGSVAPALVTPSGRTFALGSDCGVISAPVDAERLLAQGEVLDGEWCWRVPVEEVDKVALRVGGTGGGAVWFAVR